MNKIIAYSLITLVATAVVMIGGTLFELLFGTHYMLYLIGNCIGFMAVIAVLALVVCLPIKLILVIFNWIQDQNYRA